MPQLQSLSELIIQHLPIRRHATVYNTSWEGASAAVHLQIFISYARSDGREPARGLRSDLDARGFSVWQDVIAMEAGEKWWLQIQDAIERSAVVVLLFTKAALTSDVVRDELAFARRIGTPVIPVIYDAGLLSNAPDWIRDLDIIILDHKDPGHELAFHRFLNHLRNPPPRRPRPFAVPNLSHAFVPRPEILQQLLDRLIGDDGHTPVAGSTVLAGSSGFGKTTLAAAICRDDRIRSIYDDGVLWVQFRPKVSSTNVLALLNEQIAQLDPNGRSFGELTQASARFRDLLSGRRLLVVIDDVWSDAYLQYFIHPATAYVITTRLEIVVDRSDARRLAVDEMQPEEGTALLSRWIDRPISAEERPLLTSLSRALGEWALLLELAGAELKSLVSSGRSVTESVDYIKRRLGRRGYTYFDREDEINRNLAVSESLNASLNMLSEIHRQRFFELGIFPNDVHLAFATIGQLWKATSGYDDLDTEDALEAMRRMALFTRFDARAGHLRLHHIIHSLIASRLTSAPDVHRKLIDAWGDMYALPDRYAWMFIGHHLRGSNAEDQLRRLLFDFKWVHAKLSATDVSALIADYSECAGDPDCALLKSVLMMSSGAIADAAQLPTQLAGRLQRLEAGSDRIATLLSGAMVWENECALLPVQVNLPSVDVGVHETILTTAPILSSALAEDGERLLAGLADGGVEVWNWQTGVRAHQFQSGVGPVYSMAVQGDLLALGGYQDHWHTLPGDAPPLEVWNWRDCQRLGSLGENVENIGEGYSVQLYDGIAAITTGAMNNLVHLFDWPVLRAMTVITGEPTESSGNRPAHMRLVDGYLLYQNPGDSSLYITSTHDWAFCGSVVGDIDFGAAPCIARGRLLLKSKWRCSASEPHFFCKIDRAEDCAPSVAVARYHPPAFVMAQEGDTLLVCSDLVELRDVNTGNISRVLEGHSKPISGVHVIPKAILTTSRDRTIRIWDRHTFPRTSSEANERFYRPPILCLERQGDSIFVGTNSGIVQEWTARPLAVAGELSTSAAIQTLAVNEGWLAFSRFHTLKYASLEARRRQNWQSQPRSAQQKKTRHFRLNSGAYDFGGCGATKVKLFDDLCAIVVASYYTPQNSISTGGEYTGNWIYVLDLAKEEVIFEAGEWISAVALTDRVVAGGTSDGYVQLWDITTGETILRHSVHEDAVTDILLHSDLLITSSSDQTARIWKMADDLEPVQTIRHAGPVYSLRANGSLLLSASEDHTIAIHDMTSGRALASFTDDAALLSCDWDPDAGMLVAGGRSGRLHVLQANRCLLDSLRTLAHQT